MKNRCRTGANEYYNGTISSGMRWIDRSIERRSNRLRGAPYPRVMLLSSIAEARALPPHALLRRTPQASLGAPSTSGRASPRSAVSLRCLHSGDAGQETETLPRRGLVFGCVGALLLATQPAHAFGTGFPGYDLNVAARERANKVLEAEKAAQKEKAAQFRRKKQAAAAAAGEAAAAAAQ